MSCSSFVTFIPGPFTFAMVLLMRLFFWFHFPKVCCYYGNTHMIFNITWHPATLSNWHIRSNSYFIDFLGFFDITNNHSSIVSYNSFLIFMPFFLVLALLLWLRCLLQCWMKLVGVNVSVLFLILGRSIQYFTIKNNVSCSFLQMPLTRVRNSLPFLVFQVFMMNEGWMLFLYLLKWSHNFFPLFC